MVHFIIYWLFWNNPNYSILSDGENNSVSMFRGQRMCAQHICEHNINEQIDAKDAANYLHGKNNSGYSLDNASSGLHLLFNSPCDHWNSEELAGIIGGFPPSGLRFSASSGGIRWTLNNSGGGASQFRWWWLIVVTCIEHCWWFQHGILELIPEFSNHLWTYGSSCACDMVLI